MKTFDRYIIGKTAWPLAAALGVALLALLLERTVRLLDLVVNEGGTFYLLLRMLANLIPHYLGLALPAAFFIGMLLATLRFSNDSEFDAMQAAGFGLGRMLAPLMAFAAVLTLCSTIVIGYLQPHTRYAYRALVYLVTNTAWDYALERGAFFSGFGGMTISVEDITDRGRRLAGVFMHQQDAEGRSTTTTAESGQVFRSADEDRLILSLRQGVRVDSRGQGRSATIVTFDRLDLPLDMALAPAPFRQHREGYRELTLFELWAARAAPPVGMSVAGTEAEIHERLVRIATLLFLPLLALPLGTATRRASRSIGLAVGLAILVFYHHLLQLGDSLASAEIVSPWIGFWLPYALFAGFSGWACHAASTRPGFNVFSHVIGAIQRLADHLRGLLARPGHAQ